MDAATSLKMAILRLRYEFAADEVRRRLEILKKSFNSDQPRVPAGQPEGGQWTSGSVGQAASDGSDWSESSDSGSIDDRSMEVAARRSGAREAECDEQYERDVFHCNMVGSAACYQQAMLRYANCLAGLHIPPLSY